MTIDLRQRAIVFDAEIARDWASWTWSERQHRDDPICLNCQHWQYRHPEADGRSGGICRRLSGKDWRYDVIPLAPKQELILHTRCDFGCNQFSHKPPETGRIEPDIEDEP